MQQVHLTQQCIGVVEYRAFLPFLTLNGGDGGGGGDANARGCWCADVHS